LAAKNPTAGRSTTQFMCRICSVEHTAAAPESGAIPHRIELRKARPRSSRHMKPRATTGRHRVILGHSQVATSASQVAKPVLAFRIAERQDGRCSRSRSAALQARETRPYPGREPHRRCTWCPLGLGTCIAADSQPKRTLRKASCYVQSFASCEAMNRIITASRENILVLDEAARLAKDAVRRTRPHEQSVCRSLMLVDLERHIDAIGGVAILRVSFASRVRTFWRRLRGVFGRTHERQAVTVRAASTWAT
jgi:hypothetical protein